MQDITTVSMIVFGILCNFLIVVPNRLKTCRSDVFFLFYNANCERLKTQVRLRGFARLITSISIGHIICPVLFKTMLIKCQSSGETLGLLLHCYLFSFRRSTIRSFTVSLFHFTSKCLH